MADVTSGYRQENGVSLIEIRLSNILQLFNSFDPSPFQEKDLDREAEAYIVESAREFPRAAPLKLVLYVPSKEMAAAEDAKVEQAVQHYFGYRLWLERAVLRHLLITGRVSLAIGLVFLFTCITLREFITMSETSTFREIIAEGLLISGWVAMWKPLEVFLYEWWPIRRNCRLYEKLSRLPVELRLR